MPIYEYRCPVCHEVSEERRSFEEIDTPGSCARDGLGTVRIFSTFSQKVYNISWSDVAPVDEHGHPMSTMEATKAGLVDSYIPGQTERVAAEKAVQEKRTTELRMERAKRDAWKQVSAKRRINI